MCKRRLIPVGGHHPRRANYVRFGEEEGTSADVRRKLQAVYEQPTYEAAKRALRKLRTEVTLLN